MGIDFDGSFHKSLKLVADLSNVLLGTRSERYIYIYTLLELRLDTFCLSNEHLFCFVILEDLLSSNILKLNPNTEMVRSQVLV